MMNRRMMQQAQQMQKRLAEIQEQLAEEKTQATAGGGAVTVVVVGANRIESIEIQPEVVDAADVEMLQDLVMAAVNEAFETANRNAQEKLGAITGGLNIPGLF